MEIAGIPNLDVHHGQILSYKDSDGQTDGRTDGRTDRQTDAI